MTESRHKLTRSGRGWYKWLAGKTRWICSVAEAPTAEAADAIFEDRFKELCQPPPTVADLSVEALFNRYISSRLESVEAGNLSIRTLNDYIDAGYRFGEATANVTMANLSAAHFSRFMRAIEKMSPGRRAKLITVVRTVINWGQQTKLLGAVDFGPDFRIPRRLEFRRHRQSRGPQLYSPEQIRKLIVAANDDLVAMVLLALNGGMGNKDVAFLPRTAVDWKARWIRHPRAKTGIDRQFPAWPELTAALGAIERRDDELMFVRPSGIRWLSDSGSSHKDYIAQDWADLCKAAGVPNLGFYSLRRTFRTVADAVGDQRAAAAIMGHETGDMGSIYVQAVAPDRLKKVVQHVRDALGIAAAWRLRNRKRKKAAKGGG